MYCFQHIDEIGQHISISCGTYRETEINLCAVMRDEMFLLPAFFDHYRNIGVQQFIILDDGSVDGTHEFLRSQPDCVLLAATLKFGDPVTAELPDGSIFRERADPLLKCAIARMFCSGKYALSVDADEFLILPNDIPDLETAFSALGQAGVRCVAANMVEFYPAFFSDMDGDASPRSFDDLTSLYSYFDAAPLLEQREEEQPTTIRGSVTHRLFYAERKTMFQGFRDLLMKPREKPKRPKLLRVEKFPIVKWGDDVWFVGNHATNVESSAKVLLALAHFKFTHDFVPRARRAVQWNAHAGQAAKYRSYVAKLETMRTNNTRLLSRQSARYRHAPQLKSCGLLKWNL